MLGRYISAKVIPALGTLEPGRYPHPEWGPVEIPPPGEKGMLPFRLTTPGFFMAYGALLFWIARRGSSLGQATKQEELFPKLRRELRLTAEDKAKSDDPIEICLQRRYGWDLQPMRELRDSIGRKSTPDIFTKEEEPLTAPEAQLLEQIEDCLDRIEKQYGSLDAAGLPGVPCPCEDI